MFAEVGALFVGVVAGTNEGAAFDCAVSESKSKLLPAGKFLGGDPAMHFSVFAGGPEVLSDSQNLDALQYP